MALPHFQYLHPSGLTIHPQHHWLAASPDGLITDPSSPDPAGIVELKNPYTQRDMPLSEAAKGRDFCLTDSNGCLKLKRTHKFYHQVQATMFCTKRKWCDLVVRTNVDLHIERINWDPTFRTNVLPKLHSFYFTAILPELTLPYNKRKSGEIREPSEWLKDPQAWKEKTEAL